MNTDDYPGIDASKLPLGTKLLVRTRNSDYTLEKIDHGNKYRIHGGKYFPIPCDGRFVGCTYGGTAIRINWLGYLMNMELVHLENKKAITTTRVRKARIVTPTWEYEMEWPTVSISGNKAG